MKKALQTRLAKLEQTWSRRMVPSLTLLLHGKGCPEVGTCDARCERLLVLPGYGIQSEIA